MRRCVHQSHRRRALWLHPSRSVPCPRRSFLRGFLEACPDVKFLVTSRVPVGGGADAVPEKVYTLGRLPALGAAMLFARRVPRALTKREVYGVDVPVDAAGSGTCVCGLMSIFLPSPYTPVVAQQTGNQPHWKPCPSIPYV